MTNTIGYIYKITNRLNNKIYIGQRKFHNKDRIHTDTYMGSGLKIKRAIKKYGKINFQKDILEIIDPYNKTNINARELYYIQYFDATNPNIGYNIATSAQPYSWIETASAPKIKQWRNKISQHHVLTENRAGSKNWYQSTPIKNQIAYNLAMQIKRISAIKSKSLKCKQCQTRIWANTTETERRIAVIVKNPQTKKQCCFSSIRECIELLSNETWRRVEHERVKKAIDSNKPYRGYLFYKE